MREGLLEPPRVEAGRVRAHEAAWIGDAAHIGAQVTASLPETGNMKTKARCQLRLSEVDIERAAHAAPVGSATMGVAEEVIHGLKSERDTLPLEFRSRATPVSKHVRAVLPRWGRRIV